MCKESERLDIKHCREQKCREGLFEDYIIINVSPSLFIYLFYLLMSLSYGSLWIIDCQWGGHRQNTSDHYGGIWKSGKFSYDASKLLRQPSPPPPPQARNKDQYLIAIRMCQARWSTSCIVLVVVLTSPYLFGSQTWFLMFYRILRIWFRRWLGKWWWIRIRLCGVWVWGRRRVGDRW